MKMKHTSAVAAHIAATLVCSAFIGTLVLAPTAFAQAGKPTRVRTKLDGFDLSPKTGKSANQIGGASRDLKPELYAPNLGKAYTTNPEFYFTAGVPGGKVTFKLTSMDGDTLYETSTAADHLRYPGDAPALTPGATYRWTVVPENDVLGGPPAPVTFMVIGGPERDAILSELKGVSNEASTAAVFLKHKVWYDSIQSYTELIQRNPKDEDAYATRAELYDQLPVTKALAESDWRMVH